MWPARGDGQLRLVLGTGASQFGHSLEVRAAAARGAVGAGLHMALPTNGRPAPITRSRWELKLPPGLKHLSVSSLSKYRVRKAPEGYVSLSMLLEIILSIV